MKMSLNTISQTKQNHLNKYVVFIGNQNTYVNDLLEDIIVIYRYGMKYNDEFRRISKTFQKLIEPISICCRNDPTSVK